ncbi:MAG: ABC transporter ATP-binding protein [Caldisericia bacterium]|nr:ABC transporter ATP-binding protein [Caldisericia bacterium]
MNFYPKNYAIALQKISFHWKSQLILDRISFQVPSGNIVSLLGPSGCGKSTLLHIIAGLLQPDSGDICIHGEEQTNRTGSMGYMQQNDLLFPWKTIVENAALPLVINGIPKKKALQKASRCFPDFGLEGYEHYLPNELSGGMRQRAALLRTYMMDKKIILLDEPFGALDSLTRKKMQIWLLDMYEMLNSTIILVTHDIEEAIYLSDTILVMSALPGKIIHVVESTTPRNKRKKETYLNNEMLAMKKEIVTLFM